MRLARFHFWFLVFAAYLLPFAGRAQDDSWQSGLKAGWKALATDNDTLAIRCFSEARQRAWKAKDPEGEAEALLQLGIASYGSSLSQGIEFAMAASKKFQQLEPLNQATSEYGQARCLQLLATIAGRQGNFEKTIRLGKEALPLFPVKDQSSYRGLIFTSMGMAFRQVKEADSSAKYFSLALNAHLRNKDSLYLPTAYQNSALLEEDNSHFVEARLFLEKSIGIAQKTGNRQALVAGLCALAHLQWKSFQDFSQAEDMYREALSLALTLTDATFLLKTYAGLADMEKTRGRFKEALEWTEKEKQGKDKQNQMEQEHIRQNLMIQFEVARKDRKLEMLEKENDIHRLTSSLLWGSVLVLILVAGGIILFLRRLRQRDRILLKTKEELMSVLEEQKITKEKQLQAELELKESKISALGIQMKQKQELMGEVRSRLEKDAVRDPVLSRLLQNGLVKDKEWDDFNTWFEETNVHFYNRLKTLCPGISANDLRICALIKLNFSIKEMAGVLHISPDSVKTARYRLRKKLEIPPEENLSDFILGLG